MRRISRVQGRYEIGHTEARFQWVDDGAPLATIVNSVGVNKLVCDSCRLFIASCVIKRKARGVVGYWVYQPKLGLLSEDFVPLMNELYNSVVQEEREHQDAILRWIVDHEKTGYGVGCSEDTAKSLACVTARVSVVIFENASKVALALENSRIDDVGHARAAAIVRRIDRLFQR